MRAPALTYAGAVALAAAVLALAGAAPLKVALLVAAAAAVARFGVRLAGPLLTVAIVLPESGGARPAAVPHVALLLAPLVLWTLLGRTPAWFWRDRSVRAVGALAAAGGFAALLGLLVRHADPGVVLFETFRSLLPMLALVVFAAVPAGRSAEPISADPPGSPASRHWAIWLAAGASVVALLGIAQVLAGQPATEAIGSASAAIGYPFRPYGDVAQQLWWGVRKAFATFFSPNGLGTAAVFVLVYLVADWVRLGRLVPGWRMAAAALTYVVLVLTFSRASLLSAAVLLAWLALEAWRGARRAQAVVCVAAAALLPVCYLLLLNQTPGIVASGAGAATTAAAIKRETASMKVEEIRNTLAMFRAGHWFGSGAGVIYDGKATFIPADRAIGISPAYAEVVYRSGLVGLAALLYAAGVLWRVWRRTRPPVADPARVDPMRMALAAALVLSLIDHPFLTVPGTAVLFWAAWGVLVGQGHLDRVRA